MCPAGRALHYLAAKLLMEYDKVRFPTKIGKDWPIQDLEASIEVGPHISVLDIEAMGQLQAEFAEDWHRIFQHNKANRKCCGPWLLRWEIHTNSFLPYFIAHL